MVDLVNNQGVRMTAGDLSSMTDWPDILIEDYLSMSSQVNQITDQVNINTQAIEQIPAKTLARVFLGT